MQFIAAAAAKLPMLASREGRYASSGVSSQTVNPLSARAYAYVRITVASYAYSNHPTNHWTPTSCHPCHPCHPSQLVHVEADSHHSSMEDPVQVLAVGHSASPLASGQIVQSV